MNRVTTRLALIGTAGVLSLSLFASHGAMAAAHNDIGVQRIVSVAADIGSAAAPTAKAGDGEQQDGNQDDGQKGDNQGQSGNQDDGQKGDNQGQSGNQDDGQKDDNQGQSGNQDDGSKDDGEHGGTATVTATPTK
ncbi:MAG: hypothetical protein NVS2B7_26080 [Herpetosiphon sp.]